MNYNLKNNLFENNDFGIVNNNQPLLVSKKIETYFNDLIKVPESIQVSGGKNDYTFSKFYDEYIEHNLLLLFIILCLIIFLIIKYINKNYPDEQQEFYYGINNSHNKINKTHNTKKNMNNITNNENMDDTNDTDNTNDTDDTNNTDDTNDTNDTNDANYRNKSSISTLKYNKKKFKKKVKNDKYNELLRETEKKKYLLELEKQSILDIIDELSNANNKKIKKNTQIMEYNKIHGDKHKNCNRTSNYVNNDYINNDYINNDYINNDHINNDYINNDYMTENRFNTPSIIENNQNFSQYSLINSDDNSGAGDNSSYYNIRKNINYKDKKNPNYIKGIYMESPYDE
jgi:hypothetical protein